MKIPFFKAESKKGLPPGTLLPVEHDSTQEIEVELIEYSANDIQTTNLSKDVSSWPDLATTKKNIWLNIIKLHDVQFLTDLGKKVGLDKLVLEDILNTAHRSKIEAFDDYTFLVARAIHFDPNTLDFDSEQISFVVKDHCVFSFQERKEDDFDFIRKRLNKGGRIRENGADYLIFALLDAIVDKYLIVLDQFGRLIQDLETHASTEKTRPFLARTNKIRDDLIMMRSQLSPLRDMTQKFVTGGDMKIQKKNLGYYRDLHDHAQQAWESLELFIELVRGARDYHLNLLSLSSNEVMKFLTLFASIFIPLTFVAGIYGMNFQYMPELHSEWGYPGILIFMGLMAASFIIYFKKKKWI